MPEPFFTAIAIASRHSNFRMSAVGAGWVYVAAVTIFAITVGWSAPVFGQTTLQDGSDVIDNNDVPLQVRGVTVDQNLGGQIPLNLPMRDADGRRVKTGYYFTGDRPVLVTLNYSSCPMLCSVQLNALTQSLRQLDLKIGKDFDILTLSIDPSETTATIAETKSNYVNQLTSAQPTADEGWHFCTADAPIIREMADRLGFRYRRDRRTGEYYHPAMVAFVSPDGVISRYSLEVAFPVNDLRKAIIEAGEGTVGTVVDQAILWCFQFDPEANRYTMVGRRVMYFGGIIFASGMLACLLPFWIGRRGQPLSDADFDARAADAQTSGTGPVSARETKQTQLFS